jgi:predicted lipoprotein with Yx(FWY)xxD motif
MFRKSVVTLAALVAAASVLSSACGSSVDGSSSAAPRSSEPVSSGIDGNTLDLLTGTAEENNAEKGTGDWITGVEGLRGGSERSAAQKWVQLSAGSAGALDPVVVNGSGLTLYRFDDDTASPSKSTCDGECAKKWPPVTVAPGSRVFFTGLNRTDLGVVQRADGDLQVTVGGWPVYRFAQDQKPGDTLGQGVGGTWFGVTPDGRRAGGGADDSATVPAPGGAGGSALLFDDPGTFSESNASQGLSGSGCQNAGRDDVASAIRPTGSVKIWSEKNCKGKSLVVTEDIADLRTVGFDNTISSVFFG